MEGLTATDEIVTKLSSGCSTIGASPCTSLMPWMSQLRVGQALKVERNPTPIVGEFGGRNEC
jgi:hypothetical protein